MDREKYKILYVDDENTNLITFKTAFKREFTIFTASSGPEALEILKSEKEIPVIITDQRMPEMTGIEFLSKVILNYPDTIRIILTGYTDTEALIDAINTGKVYRYIVKPWNIPELKQTLKDAFHRYFLSKENKLLLKELKSKNDELGANNIKLSRAMEELKKAQELVIAQEKKAIIGVLTAGLAHEIKNQLNTLGFLDIIQEELSKENLKYLQYIYDSRDRILNLINEVKAFAKNEEIDFPINVIDLNPVIEEAIYIVKMDLDVKKKNITFEGGHNKTVLMNKNKIMQVLLNLIRNAAHAIDSAKESKITIKTEESNLFAHIHVIDNGSGIESEKLSKIWEPFFTTKGENGTGIGLSISKNIVEKHNGVITCLSEVNKGTTFTFTLPIAKA